MIVLIFIVCAREDLSFERMRLILCDVIKSRSALLVAGVRKWKRRSFCLVSNFSMVLSQIVQKILTH